MSWVKAVRAKLDKRKKDNGKHQMLLKTIINSIQMLIILMISNKLAILVKINKKTKQTI